MNSVTLSGIEKAPEATWPSFLFLRKVMPKVTQRERKVCVGGGGGLGGGSWSSDCQPSEFFNLEDF